MFGFQLVQMVGALDDQRKHIRIDRLLVKIVGAERHGLHGVLPVVIPGDHNHLGAGRGHQDLR